MIHDRSLPPNLIGFAVRDHDDHFDALKASNARPCRRDELRTVAMVFVLSADDALREAACSAITGFPNDLPYEVEEQRNDPGYTVAEAHRTAEIWAEIAKPENYRVYRTQQDDGLIIKMESPNANDPDVVAVVERQQRHANHWTLLSWAQKVHLKPERLIRR